MKISSIILLTLLLIAINPEQVAVCNCSEISVKDANETNRLLGLINAPEQLTIQKMRFEQ